MSSRGSIRAAVKQWSQRKNIPDDVLNDFIEIGLSRATWALRIPPLERFASITISDTGFAQLPADYMEVKELYVTVNGKSKLLERKSINEVESLSNVNFSGTLPELFARFGNYFKIAPWSLGTGTQAGLYYYGIETKMEDDGATNWFCQYAPNVLLYGALQELCDYTRDPEGAALWGNKFTNEINILQAVEDKAAWSGSSLAVSMNGSIRGRMSI